MDPYEIPNDKPATRVIFEGKQSEEFCNYEEYEKPPFFFVGYDLGTNRHQYSYNKTLFNSLDDLIVTVDHSKWLGLESDNKFSVVIRASKHRLILHPNAELQFMFHFYARDGTVILFSKPYQENREESLVKCVYKSQVAKDKNVCRNSNTCTDTHDVVHNTYQPKQPFHLTHQMQRYIAKEIRIPYVYQIKKYVFPDILTRKISNSTTDVHYTTCIEDYINETQEHQNSEQHHESIKHQTKTFCKKYCKIIADCPDKKESIKITCTFDEIKAKIKEALKQKQPKFKVCSSKANRRKYLVPIKDYLEIKFGGTTQRVPFKPTFTKKSISKTTVWFPLENEHKKHPYDINITMPSQLHIKIDIQSENHSPIVTQSYESKELHCKDIEDEEYRIFLNNGTVLIKKLDGTVVVYCLNGTIIHYDVPFFLKHGPLKKKRNNYIKSEEEILRRRMKHLIRGSENQSRYKQPAKCINLKSREVYLMKDGGFFVQPKFSILTTDGERIHLLKGNYGPNYVL